MSKTASLCRPWQFAGVAAATIFTAFVPLPRATGAENQPYSVVARVDRNSAGLTSRDITVRVGDVSVPASAIEASPDISRNVAIVLDDGPDQVKVLSREKDLAIALVNELSDAGTSFTIASAGASSKIRETTWDRSAAIKQVREITEDNGERTNVPIYDAIGSAMRQISLTPGLRIVIFIGEGNDRGSRLHYPELRSLAESDHIAFFAGLVADHSLREAKSILRYGWNLEELTSDTVGIFLENQKTPEATQRFSKSIRDLRLITFDMSSRQPGRHKISVSSNRGRHCKVQKAILVP